MSDGPSQGRSREAQAAKRRSVRCLILRRFWRRRPSVATFPSIQRRTSFLLRATMPMRFSISRKAKSKSPSYPMKERKPSSHCWGPDEFVGEGCLIGQPKRLATASAMTECETMRVEKSEIQRVIRDEPAFSQMFVVAYSGEERPGRRRPSRSAFQLNRKTACAAVIAVGKFCKGRSTGANSRKDQSGNTR